MAALADSLRSSLLAESTMQKTDVRFEFGTEMKSEYKPPPPSAYATWQPLPLSYADHLSAITSQAAHVISQSSIFPRLSSTVETVRAKLYPTVTALDAACKALDSDGTGELTQDQVEAALKATGVFLNGADMECLIPALPRTPKAKIPYQDLISLVLGKGINTMTTSGLTRGHQPLPSNISWPEGQGFSVSLRLRPSSTPFEFESERMAKYARAAQRFAKEEGDAEKVHALVRMHLLSDLVIEPGRPAHPDRQKTPAELAFRNWLHDNGVMSLTMRSKPGPIPPEVYDVLDQVAYKALGLPPVISATQVLTSLGASMRYTH